MSLAVSSDSCDMLSVSFPLNNVVPSIPLAAPYTHCIGSHCWLSMLIAALALLGSALTTAHAVTVYGQIPLAQTIGANPSAGTALPATRTLAAYDKTVLNPPALPSPPPAAAYTLSLQKDAGAVNGLSIPHVGGSFWGFSIEMSVISQVCEYP